MFKFKINIGEEHRFKTFIKDEHRFIMTILNGTLYRNLDMVNKYNSKVEMGGRKIKLNEMEGMLKELPPSLRQLVGTYVYIKAKIKWNNVAVYGNSLLAALKTILRINTSYSSSVKNTMKIKSKTRLNNSYRLYEQVKCKIGQKINVLNKYTHKTTLLYAILLKTKVNIAYKSYAQSAFTYFVKCKMKFNNSSKSVVKIVSKIKAKMKSKENIYNSKVSIKCQSRGKFKVGIDYRSRSITISRVLAKMRFSSTQKESSSLISNIKSKLKLNNSIFHNEKIIFNAYSCKRLVDYTNTQLNQTPNDLFDFCYGSPINSWRNVIKRNKTWEQVKADYTTWSNVKG